MRVLHGQELTRATRKAQETPYQLNIWLNHNFPGSPALSKSIALTSQLIARAATLAAVSLNRVLQSVARAGARRE
eukprot:7629549-Lingulodinium_polyedra.AAC.1